MTTSTATIKMLIVVLIVCATAVIGSAQWRRGRGFQQTPDRSNYPIWSIDTAFQDDVFTFARIRYDGWSLVDSRWDNDYPDGDWNFSFRLQQLTSLQVDPNGVVLRLADPALFDYPFIFILGTRDLVFSDEAVVSLRRYLSNGGFLMVDDFWAPEEMRRIRSQMQRVLPNVEPRELSLDHEIFHIVYDLPGIPQIPSIHSWRNGSNFEYWHGDPEGDEDGHFWGYFDEQDRLMVLLCHNNDICDGWEREGENSEYFKQYSAKWSYPMGINIITYAMTH